jgi:hypothetical protein
LATVTFPVARTRNEALLYFDLNPCVCGSVETEWDGGVVSVDGRLATRYDGTCARCGAARQYVFALPSDETAPEGWPTFGGVEPSQLVDAGEWLWVADLTASDVPPDPEGAGRALAMACAAVEEVLKFIPPGGDRVPDQGFWTDRGREFRDAEPGRFRRERLEVLRDHYLAG